MSAPQKPSLNEEWMWIVERGGLSASVYNLESVLRLHGELDLDAVRGAFTAVVDRHSTLRTRFPEGPDGPVRLVTPAGEAPLDFEVVDAGDGDAVELAGELARVPFDVVAGPLLRVRVLRVGEAEHVVLVVAHHMVFDGWSEGLLWGEFAALYGGLVRGDGVRLDEVGLQYGDFAVWQRERLTGGVLEELVGFWRGRLAGAGVLELPVDRGRPAVQGHRGRECRFVVPGEVVWRLRELARAERTTLFSVLYAAYHALLARYARQDDVCVGVPLSNRTLPGSEAVVGLFLNTVVLRPEAGDDPAFRDLVARVRGEFLDAAEHGELPFSRLVEELQPERDLSRNPLFQAMFTMAVAHPVPDIPGLRAERFKLPARTSFVDVAAEAYDQGDTVEIHLCLDADLFEDATARAMADDFLRVLTAVADRPGLRLSRTPEPSAAVWRCGPRAAATAPATPRPGPADPPAAVDQALVTALTEIWSRTLDCRVGGQEDFFDLGGNSLLAIRIVSEVRARDLGRVTVRDVFETRTVQALAARLADRPASGEAPTVPARPTRRGRALTVPAPQPPGGAK